jgi:glycosyltransferase involved in cell wall biosynthesis
VVVNDGSRDGTGKILDQLAVVDTRIRVVHQQNGGHGRALRTGLDAAQGTFVFLLDSDRQIPLEHFQALWDAALKGDGAFGVRRVRGDAWTRRVLTRLVRWALRLLLGVTLADSNVPFKVLRRSVWLSARDLIPEETLAPSLFLAVYAQKRGLNVATLPVSHVGRQTGVVSIRKWKLLKFCTKAFLQLLAFRRRLSQ